MDIKSTAYFEIIFHVDYILRKYFRHFFEFYCKIAHFSGVIIECYYIIFLYK